jgi:uroporphyrinogen-III synthase
MTAPLPLIILRPEPGASATAARARDAGLEVRSVPLFAAGPIEWAVPDPSGFDGLLLTSANAPRFAGAGLAPLSSLPLWCVGSATAAAATANGLAVHHVGTGGAQALIDLAAATGVRTLVWLAGEDRTPLNTPQSLTLSAIPVYRAHPLALSADQLVGPAVVLVHSKRAARRLASLAPDHGALTLVAISEAVAAEAGGGWATVCVAPSPDDGEMVAMAAKLCHEGLRKPLGAEAKP